MRIEGRMADGSSAFNPHSAFRNPKFLTDAPADARETPARQFACYTYPRA
jgi:hypothetical protein